MFGLRLMTAIAVVLLVFAAFAIAPAVAQDTDSADDNVRQTLERQLATLRAALVRQDAPAVWAVMDDGSRKLVADQLAALQAVVHAIPAELRTTRPSGWAEADTLAAIPDATPTDLLAIWLRSDQGRVVAGDLQNMGRITDLTVSDDGTTVRFTLDGPAVFPPYAATRTEDGWRLRFLY